jgi:hypothetical protein
VVTADFVSRTGSCRRVMLRLRFCVCRLLSTPARTSRLARLTPSALNEASPQQQPPGAAARFTAACGHTVSGGAPQPHQAGVRACRFRTATAAAARGGDKVCAVSASWQSRVAFCLPVHTCRPLSKQEVSPAASPASRDRDKDREAHKHFDEAVITVAVGEHALLLLLVSLHPLASAPRV